MSINKLNQCIFTLTRNCNLRCEFCYAKKDGYDKRDFVDLATLKKIVDLCGDAKPKYIFLTGGEPTTYPELLELLHYIKSRPHEMIPTIATNGILLADYDYCRKLLDAGLGYVDVSTKGKDSREWLQTVGYDGLSKQLKAIENLAKLGADFTSSMVITEKNVKTFCAAVNNAYNAGARQFSFTFVIDNDDSELSGVKYLKKNDPMALVNDFMVQTEELDRITKGEWWIEFSLPFCVFTKDWLSELEGRLAAPCYVREEEISTIEFDTKLNLIPCSMISDGAMGQFGKDFTTFAELEEYVGKGLYKKITDELRKLPSETCSSCQYVKNCLGGCPWFWKHCSFEEFMEFKRNKGITA